MANQSIVAQAGEAKYLTMKTAVFVSGKRGAVLVGEAAETAIKPIVGETAMQVAGAGAGLAHIYAMGIMMALGAAVSAAVTQMEYNHKRDKTRKDYSDEMEAISETDLDKLAKSNHVIAEELNQQKRQRNFGVFFSVAATLVSLFVVTQLVALPALPLTGLAAGIANFAMEGALGLLTYNVVKQPLHWLGDKLFHLDEKTTHGRIVDLRRDHEEGKQVTREQVLAVFASAQPKLDSFLVSQYGKHFDELDLADKRHAAEDLNHMLPLDRLAADINAGKINATELAFAVEGQASGVAHDPQPMPHRKPGVIGTMMAKIRHAMHHAPQATVQRLDPDAQAAPKTTAVIVHEAHSTPHGSFVQRLGLSAADSGLSRVQRLELKSLADAAERTGPH